MDVALVVATLIPTAYSLGMRAARACPVDTPASSEGAGVVRALLRAVAHLFARAALHGSLSGLLIIEGAGVVRALLLAVAQLFARAALASLVLLNALREALLPAGCPPWACWHTLPATSSLTLSSLMQVHKHGRP